MRSVREACDELTTKLKAVGFDSVDVNPELVNPPSAVWIQPRTISGLTLGGGGTLTVWLFLIVSDVETAQAIEQLDDALAGVLEIDDVSLSDDEEAIDLTAAVILPHTVTPLPAYRLAVDIDL